MVSAMTNASSLDVERARRHVAEAWDASIVPALTEYIRIPNKSPLFDPAWAEHGHMDRAVELMRNWCEAHALPGMTVEVVRLPGRTPLLFIEVPGSSDDTVLMYGHMDKQPEFTGWSEGLAPWTPVLRNGRLYGRGGADDGYAVFGSVLALRTLADQNIPHARCVILIEGSEESGSPDLPPTSTRSPRASGSRRSSCVSMRNAATTISSGSRVRCAATSSAR
jgi:acetylornithine deacetylase/succinyl-diaminopimelate desuccinylase-like protein